MNKLTSFFSVIILGLSFSAFSFRFDEIIKTGFYVPKKGAKGALYLAEREQCKNKEFKVFDSYAVFVTPDRISTPLAGPLSNVPCIKQPFQSYSLSSDGLTLTVDLQLGVHRFQTTLAASPESDTSQGKLVYEGPYRGRIFKMTFKKVGENELSAIAQDNGKDHAVFNLIRLPDDEAKPLRFAEKAGNMCTWVVDRFKSLCGQRPPKED